MRFSTSAQLRASDQSFKQPFFNKKWMRYLRVLGIKVIGKLLEDFYLKNFEVYGECENWMIVLQSEEETRSKLIYEKLALIQSDRWIGSPKTVIEACRVMKYQHLLRKF